MVQLLELIQELQIQISSLSLTSSSLTITSSSLTITLNSDFPVKIPFSSSTIDQVIYSAKTWTQTPYYFSTGSFRPFGMTIGNQSGRMAITWGINRNTVHRDVWINEWTVVTRVWYLKPVSGFVVKFGEKWDRWDTGLDGTGNNGDLQTFGPDVYIPQENMYMSINYPMSDNPTSGDNIATMTTIGTSNLSGLKYYWLTSPDFVVATNPSSEKVYGGVYIIISYDKTAITIKLCTSDGTVYYSTKTNYNPLTNDRRPFHIYSNVGIPVWYYGIVLTNTLSNNPIDDINMFKNQFSLLY
jgi:hypothetical protein